MLYKASSSAAKTIRSLIFNALFILINEFINEILTKKNLYNSIK